MRQTTTVPNGFPTGTHNLVHDEYGGVVDIGAPLFWSRSYRKRQALTVARRSWKDTYRSERITARRKNGNTRPIAADPLLVCNPLVLLGIYTYPRKFPIANIPA
jgi:hypothetical protein